MSEKSTEADPATKSENVPTSSPQGVGSESTEFPELTWRAWTTLVGASLMQFSTFGYTNSFGVYQGVDFYVREYLTKYTPSDIGWIGGVQIFLIFASGIVTGRAFDRGYFHHLMIGGSLLYSFSYFMLSLSHENQYYQVFLSHGLGGGLATGMVYIPSLAIVSHYFQRHRPLAMGIVAGGTALGAVIHPIMLNQLFHGHVGFHNGVRISAGLNTGLLIISNTMMRTRLPPKKTGSSIPLAEFARDTPYLFSVFGAFTTLCGLFFPPFYLQLDAVKHGVDSKFAFYCLSIMNAASVIGRVVPPIFAPKYGVFNLLIFFTACMGLLIYCLGAVKNAGGFVAFAVTFGFASGGAIALTPPSLSSLAHDMSEIGARIGIAFAISGIMGLFATPISGALLTGHFNWWRPIIFGATTMVGSACFYTISRFLTVQRRGTQIV